MPATERIRSILATLDADLAALTRLRALVAAALGTGAEPEPGNSPAPAPQLRLVPEPTRALREPRSKYMRPILLALADGPLTSQEIQKRIGKASGYWWSAFQCCPWFERDNPGVVPVRGSPAVWRLTEAGRAALAGPAPESSAGTAEPAASTGLADSAGDVTIPPA